MARRSHIIQLKLGTDVHKMVKNPEDLCYCTKCSIRMVCFDMGQNSRRNFCDAVLQEVYEYPREEFSLYGGHFELKE